MKMTKDEFRILFLRALNVAAKNVDKKAAAPISRSFAIELHAPGAPDRLVNVDDATDYLYVDGNRFYKGVDIAIKELKVDRSESCTRIFAQGVKWIFCLTAGKINAVAEFAQTYDPAGLGPFTDQSVI